MVRRRDSSLGGTTRSPPASPSLPVILSNSCRFCDIRRNNAPGWLKLLGIADADSTSMSRRVHSSLEQFFDKARKSGSHLTLRWRETARGTARANFAVASLLEEDGFELSVPR